MKRCVIVGGADINDYEHIRELIRPDDFCIFCDCGMRHSVGLGAEPDLIIGDFDSSENPGLPVETIVLPHRKDDTDTVYAVKEALRRGFDDFLLLGVVGNRLDHSLVNVYVLLMLRELGKHAVIADDYSEMELIGSETTLVPDSYPYFSLVNITGTARGITIKNAIFPLENGEVTQSYQYATSNEVVPGESAEISVGEGYLLLIKDRK